MVGISIAENRLLYIMAEEALSELALSVEREASLNSMAADDTNSPNTRLNYFEIL